MKWNKSLLIIAALMFCFLTGNSLAQISGDTYKISTGGVAGGGGVSESPDYSLTGVVPLTGAVSLSSTTYSLTSGSVGIVYGSLTTLKTLYNVSNDATVPPTDQTLKVAYSGSSGDAIGAIYYRQGGSASYQTAAMTAGTGDTLVYNLVAGLLNITGLEYYFEVERGVYISRVGSAGSPLVFRVSLTNAQAQMPTATVAKRYRIVGVPLEITGTNNVATVFEDDLGVFNTSQWRVGRYRASTGVVHEYNDAENIIPGRGYWLITATTQTFGAAGASVRPNRVVDGIEYLEVPLSNGWNQLANPFGFRIAWDEIRFAVNGTAVDGHPSATLEDAAYSYNGSGYVTYNAIPAWEGVFVRINQDNVTALMPYKATTVAPKLAPLKDQPVYSDFSWNIEVQLETAEYLDQANFIGVRPDALEGPDDYDFSEPPAAPEAPTLGFRIPDENNRLRRTDYRPPFTDGAVWEVEISKASDRKIRITGLENMPDNMEAWMVTNDGRKVDLSITAEIIIPDRVESAKLIIGSRLFTSNEIASLLPTKFALEQNYPNPFNPQTSIRFALPTNGFTALEIYNVLGQKVKTLIEKDLEAGYHTVIWNGDDNNGKESASGIYFYRLKSGDKNAYKKMLLIK